MADRIAVFVDYENALRTGRDVFSPGAQPWTCAPDPVRLSQRVMRRRPENAVELACVNVYRGHPDPRKEQRAASTSDRQKASWERDSRVRVIRRALTYRRWPDLPPVEKGIDVKLAVDLIHTAMQRTYDILIVFSSDADLVPAIELASEIGARVETATWLLRTCSRPSMAATCSHARTGRQSSGTGHSKAGTAPLTMPACSGPVRLPAPAPPPCLPLAGPRSLSPSALLAPVETLELPGCQIRRPMGMRQRVCSIEGLLECRGTSAA